MQKKQTILVIAAVVLGTSLIFSLESKIDPNPKTFFKLPLAPNKISQPGSQTRTLAVPVLMYHYIREAPDPEKDNLGFSLSVTPKNFEEQMKYLKENRYEIITPEELIMAWQGKFDLPAKPVILTFDDGYEDFYATAYPILKKTNFKATVFLITDFVSEPRGRYLTWEQVKELDQTGLVSFGSHTRRHVNLVTNPEAEKEITESKKIIESHLGHAITSLAYPSGVIIAQAIEMVKSAGYQLAFTTLFGIKHSSDDRFALRRVRISGSLVMEKFIERIQGKFSPAKR